jgi:hypothetical protein
LKKTAASWSRDAFEALRQIVLIERRVNGRTDTVKELHTCPDLDRRLVRLEAKVELLDRLAASGRGAWPEKSGK